MNTEKQIKPAIGGGQKTVEAAEPKAEKSGYRDTLKKVEKLFSHIVGMEEQVAELIRSVMSFFNGGELVSILIEAEAGKGKTALLAAYAKALELVGITAIQVTPSEFRKSGDETWAEIMNALCEQRHDYALLIDEGHELFANGATVQLKKIASFALKALDGNFKGGTIRLGDNIIAEFHRKNCALALATNFPGRIPEAIRSRAFRMILPDYSEKDLQKILLGMATKNGLTLAAETAKIIAKCGRGTARPMEQIVRQLNIQLASAERQKSTVNRDDVIDALRSLQMFPRGLNVNEVKLLERCAHNPVPDRIQQAMFPGSDAATLRKSRAYLMLPTEGKNGDLDGAPFLAPVTGGFMTTDKGKRYLDDCRKAGFAW